MKKRIAAIITVLSILAVMTTAVFADGNLAVESIFPGDGDTGLQLTNQMARIVFNNDIAEQYFSDQYFSIKDDKGKKCKILVLEQTGVPNRVNLVVDGDLKESTDYTIIISAKVADVDGNALGETQKFTFKTKSQKTESIITTVLMFVMFGAIILFTVRDAKKQAAGEESGGKNGGQKQKQQKVNPYKEAKKEALKEAERRTGKKIDPSVKNNVKRKAQNKKKKKY